MSSGSRKRVIQNYTLNELIGEGVFGKVYKSSHKTDPMELAIKVVPVQVLKENKKLQQCTVNQINTLSSIKPSPHIVKYKEMLKTPNNFYFVYEFCNGGTLETLLKKERHLAEEQALGILKQLVEAFRVLNEYNIMHRDVKPDNILFHNGVVKLGDFGFCKSLANNNDMTSTMLGSPIYMAPQVLKGEVYTTKADVWSLGVVLFQMLFGYCPYESNSIANLISTIKDSHLKLPLDINGISEKLQYLIRKMLIKDQTQRISWAEIFAIEITNGRIVEKEQVREERTQPAVVEAVKEEKPKVENVEKVADGSLSVTSSLKWGDDSAFKEFLSKVNTSTFKNHQKISVQASLPSDLASIHPTLPPPSKPYSNSHSIKSVTASIQRSSSTRRKELIQQHEFCTRGIKTAIDIINVDDKNTLVYSYLILTKVEGKLKGMCEFVGASDSEVGDIVTAIKTELGFVEKNTKEIKQGLIEQGVELKNLVDPRIYLSVKFREGETESMRVWFDMVNLLLGDRMQSSREKSKEEMVDFIRAKITTIA